MKHFLWVFTILTLSACGQDFDGSLSATQEKGLTEEELIRYLTKAAKKKPTIASYSDEEGRKHLLDVFDKHGKEIYTAIEKLTKKAGPLDISITNATVTWYSKKAPFLGIDADSFKSDSVPHQYADKVSILRAIKLLDRAYDTKCFWINGHFVNEGFYSAENKLFDDVLEFLPKMTPFMNTLDLSYGEVRFHGWKENKITHVEKNGFIVAPSYSGKNLDAFKKLVLEGDKSGFKEVHLDENYNIIN